VLSLSRVVPDKTPVKGAEKGELRSKRSPLKELFECADSSTFIPEVSNVFFQNSLTLVVRAKKGKKETVLGLKSVSRLWQGISSKNNNLLLGGGRDIKRGEWA